MLESKLEIVIYGGKNMLGIFILLIIAMLLVVKFSISILVPKSINFI